MHKVENKIINGFGQFLISHDLIDEGNVQYAFNEAHQKNISFIHYLAENQHLSCYKLALSIAKYFTLPIYDLNDYDLMSLPLDLLTPTQIKKNSVIPLYLEENIVVLAVADPTVLDLNEINFLTGRRSKIAIVEYDKLTTAINKLCSLQVQVDLALTDYELGKTVNQIHLNERIDYSSQELQSNSAPVVKFLNSLFLDAIQRKVSDIHFEPYEHYFRIRYRVDGLLHEACQPPAKLAKNIVARLKVLANLDIAERRLPQDGRFNLPMVDFETIDFRLSTCPTLYGEKCVLRILGTSKELLEINSLGMQTQQQLIFTHAINQPQGMILVTGPTGSGKTMTLYTALAQLNTSQMNLLSIEDPIEIAFPGINQVQVNLKTKMTFEKALRAFLRQDPDVIMIGEIRDLKTAKIAIKAAQTGHLVLSSLHTNSAIETLTRLANLGIAPFLITSSVLLIIAQRLVRKLCEHCKKPLKLSPKELLGSGFLEEDLPNLELFEANSCTKCLQGYKGRAGVFETLVISPEMNQLIMEKATVPHLIKQAHQENFVSLRRSGLNQVKEGKTSLTEINRVMGNFCISSL